MTHHLPANPEPVCRKALSLCATLWALLPVGLFENTTPDGERAAMQTADLWTLIEHLPARAPFTKEGLEQALSIVLLREETANEYFDSFGCGPVLLANEMEVEHLEFRVSKRDPVNRWMLWLLLAGRCAERVAVLARYADLKITQSPSGGSLDSETTWSRQEPWGRLSFGFAERNFNCLRSVAFGGPKW